MPIRRIKSVVESVLFLADAPVSLDRLCGIIEEYDRQEIRQALELLREEYALPERGIYLAEVAGGYQFRTNPENAGFIRRLARTRAFKFSQSALETLAIIAYRQPITRPELEYFRGVDSGGVIKTLLEKKLIKILGKKDVPGKPMIYGTTREFLETFNLRDLSSLPTLKEIQQLDETSFNEQQQDLPLGLPEPADEEE